MVLEKNEDYKEHSSEKINKIYRLDEAGLVIITSNKLFFLLKKCEIYQRCEKIIKSLKSSCEVNLIFLLEEKIKNNEYPIGYIIDISKKI